MKILAPIVGAFFRPPAKAILSNLPGETPLLLEAEPDNIYDINAVKISVLGATLSALDPETKAYLEEACAAQGTTPEELYSAEAWHVGYVCSKKTGTAARLAPLMPRFESAKLQFDISGKPIANVTLRDE